jgi:hypothetical protein
MEQRTCVYCKVVFSPNKYSPRQQICSGPDCQKRRQLESMKLWRQRNPNYFKYDESKGAVWLETQRKRSKLWREKNPDKVRSYRSAHSEEYRQYMREYMRVYREKKRRTSPADGTASNGGRPTPPSTN